MGNLPLKENKDRILFPKDVISLTMFITYGLEYVFCLFVCFLVIYINMISRESKIHSLTLQKELAFALRCTVHFPLPVLPSEFIGVRDAKLHTKFWTRWS